MKFIDRLNLLPMWAVRTIGVILFFLVIGTITLLIVTIAAAIL